MREFTGGTRTSHHFPRPGGDASSALSGLSEPPAIRMIRPCRYSTQLLQSRPCTGLRCPASWCGLHGHRSPPTQPVGGRERCGQRSQKWQNEGTKAITIEEVSEETAPTRDIIPGRETPARAGHGIGRAAGNWARNWSKAWTTRGQQRSAASSSAQKRLEQRASRQRTALQNIAVPRGCVGP